MAKRNKIRQSYIFHDYYSRLKNIALSVFKWENLPDSCNARFLEKCLFEHGCAIFVDDEDTGFLNLKATQADTLNVYGEPRAFTAFGIGYNKIYERENCVYIRNNYLEKSTDSTLILFAERLANIEMTLQVNIHAQKTPILIRCDKKLETSLKTVYQQYEGDEPVIFASKLLTEGALECLKTDAPFIADKLREEKRAVWNEALEFLGINTNPADKKKERLITSEVDSNNEQIDIQTLTMLLCRQQACDEINKKYGLNVKVSMRVDELKNIHDQNIKLTGELPQSALEEVL